MTPRKASRAHDFFTWMLSGDNHEHNYRDGIPAQIADGVFLENTNYRFVTRSGKYEVTGDVRIIDGEAVCVGLSVKTTPDSGPVTASVLREIPVAAMVRHSITAVGGRLFRYVDGEKVDVATQTAVDKRATEKRPKRSPRSEVLPRVVAEYRQALADPMTRDSATQTVADRLHYERGYVSRLLSEARKMDPPLLGPAKPGKSGEWTHN